MQIWKKIGPYASSEGAEWGRRWSIGGSPNPDTNRRRFLLAMTQAVIDANVTDWRERFVLWETPRHHGFDLNMPEWEYILRGEQATDERPEYVVVDTATVGDQIGVEEELELDWGLDDEELLEAEALLLAAEASLNVETRPAFVPAVSSSATVIRPATAASRRSTGSLDGFIQQSQRPPTRPTWARVDVPESLIPIIHQALTVSSREFQRCEDFAMMEFFFQETSRGTSRYRPNSRPFWDAAIQAGLLSSRRSPDTYKTRWIKYVSKEYNECYWPLTRETL